MLDIAAYGHDASDHQDDAVSNQASLADQFLPLRLMRVAQRVQLAFTRKLTQELGIGIAEWRLITVLEDNEDLSANEVAALAGMDKVQVSRAVSRALRHGLLTRLRDSNDRRRTVLNLTDKGKDAVNQCKPLAENFDNALRDGLGSDKTDQLNDSLDGLDKLAENLLK